VNTNLVAAIDDLVEKKTFSLDALKAIQDLRAKAEKSLETEAQNAAKITSQADNLSKLSAEINAWQSKDAALKAREDAVAKREAAITRLELETAVANAGMNVMRETVSMFLRNRVVREDIVSSTPVGVPGGGGGPGYIQNAPKTENITREEQ